MISTAERTQLDGGVQDNNIECSIRQMQVKGLGADEIDTLVGGSFISPLLSVELESIAKAVNNGCVRADDTHLAGRKGNLTRSDDYVPLALDEMEIGALQCAP